MLINGQIWQDDEGNDIQARGGMITRFGDTWYWYGENKGAPNCPGETRVDVIGVSCYSSLPVTLNGLYMEIPSKGDFVPSGHP